MKGKNNIDFGNNITFEPQEMTRRISFLRFNSPLYHYT